MITVMALVATTVALLAWLLRDYIDRPTVRFDKHDLWVGVSWERWHSTAGARPVQTRWAFWVFIPTIVVRLGWHHGH